MRVLIFFFFFIRWLVSGWEKSRKKDTIKIHRMFVLAYNLAVALKVAGRIERGNVIFILVRGYYPLPWGKKF